jgi:hypothetical protein
LCPAQKRDTFSHFVCILADFLLAIVTNRTMIWKYWDKETCIQLHGQGCDNNLKNQSACDLLLKRVDWTWPENEVMTNTEHFELPTRIEQLESADWHEEQVVVFPTLTRQELQNILFKGSMIQNSSVNDTIHKLFDQGQDFLYGMLFHEAFGLQSAVKEDAFANSFPGVIFDETSIAMVSSPFSFTTSDDDKLDCLSSLLRSSPELPCHVFAALNQADVQGRLISRMNRTCTVWDADIPSAQDDYNQSLSFLRSQLLASYARSGFIASDHHHYLSYDWIEYKRRLEMWRLGRDPPILPEFRRCVPKRADLDE